MKEKLATAQTSLFASRIFAVIILGLVSYQFLLGTFINGKHKTTIVILLSNRMFSGIHIHLDMRFEILTLIPGIFWGIMYNKQKSLLGVSISHSLIGLFLFMFMGLV